MDGQVFYSLVRFVYIIIRDRLRGIFNRNFSLYIRHSVLLNDDILLNFGHLTKIGYADLLVYFWHSLTDSVNKHVLISQLDVLFPSETNKRQYYIPVSCIRLIGKDFVSSICHYFDTLYITTKTVQNVVVFPTLTYEFDYFRIIFSVTVISILE